LSDLYQNTRTAASGRSQVTYKEESWSCGLGLVPMDWSETLNPTLYYVFLFFFKFYLNIHS